VTNDLARGGSDAGLPPDDSREPELGDAIGVRTEPSSPETWPPILILGRDTCEDTIRSRGHLHLLGIPYIYRNVELDPEADAWNRSFNGGDRVTPVILVGDPEEPKSVLIEPTDEELSRAIADASAAGTDASAAGTDPNRAAG
jgi:hypothetical protein